MAETEPHIIDDTPSDSDVLFLLLAEVMDEDGAWAALDDMGWPTDIFKRGMIKTEPRVTQYDIMLRTMSKTSISISPSLLLELEALSKVISLELSNLRHTQGLPGIPDNQLWYWSKEWQERERQADYALDNGEVEFFQSADVAIQYLDKLTAEQV